MNEVHHAFLKGRLGTVNILRPNGSVERMIDGQRRPGVLARYGREKEGSPRDARSLKIAHDNDRRRHDRRQEDPSRGHLVDVSA